METLFRYFEGGRLMLYYGKSFAEIKSSSSITIEPFIRPFLSGIVDTNYFLDILDG